MPKTLAINPLHPLFAAEVIGLNLQTEPDLQTLAQIDEAFARYSVLVFRDQAVSDDQQIVFAKHFGDLEKTKVGTPGAGSQLITLTNLGPDGEIVAPSDRQVLNNKANQSWHSDSSFKAVPAKASLLSARLVPREGGNTEFLSMRAAYAALPAATKARIDNLTTIHDYAYGRQKIDPNLVTEEERRAVPPVEQAMVLCNERGEKALYLGAHCARVVGLSENAGRDLIDELMEFVDQPPFIYAHRWQPNDMILWDNRAVMHRAKPFASTSEKRLMVRATIAGDAPTIVRPAS